MLSVCTTDLNHFNKKTAFPVRKAVPNDRYMDPDDSVTSYGFLLLWYDLLC